MATKENTKTTLKNRRVTAKKNIIKFHDSLINTSEELLENTFKTGDKWQKLMANTIKETEPIREKQVDMLFDTVEAIKGQVEHGTKRFKNLIGVEGEVVEKMKNKFNSNKLVKKVKTEVEEFVDEVSDNPIVKKAEKVTAKIKVEVSDAIEEVKENFEEVKDKVSDAFENLIDGNEVSNLKVIDGIGPKLESVLNEAGISTYTDLAKTSKKNLQDILDNAGPRYRMHNPEDWKVQAKMASAGKMEDLAAWIKAKKATK